MYKFITVARNILSETYPIPMYVYQNEDNNKYYMSRMYPDNSKFEGKSLLNQNKFYSLEYPQEISEDDLKKGKTEYWKMTWTFKI